jgi:hypothetical protein
MAATLRAAGPAEGSQSQDLERYFGLAWNFFYHGKKAVFLPVIFADRRGLDHRWGW